MASNINKINRSALVFVKNLGEGGFSDVYQMTWESPNGPVSVAAKKLHKKDQHELQVLSELDHQNIIKLIGVVDEDMEFMLILELCEGGSLRSYLKARNGRRLSAKQFYEFAEQAARPLEYLRENKWIHKDVKSPNYMVTSQNTLKLGDFGLAKNIDQTIFSATVAASYRWMAPELLVEGVLSPKYDIFALAVVLWELWTGRFPWEGVQDPTIVYKVCNNNERLPIPEDCPEPFKDLLKQCWQKEWKYRPDIIQVLQVIISSPYQYDLHIQLITLLSKEGELDKLRTARQRMSEHFPLTGELWLAWIQDELKLQSDDKDKERIIELFDRAVKDYMSPDVWLEYAQFCIGGIGTPEGIARARGVFERAITAVGLHVSKGSTVWEVYREFENALLATIQPPLGAIATPEKEKELKAQTDRISTIFRRQLSVPLLDMEQTYEEFDQWSSDPLPGYVKQTYQKSLDKLKKYIPYENKLLAAKPPKLSEYQLYINFEVSEGDPVRIQCIYERAIADNCLVADLWKNYTTYLSEQLKIKSVVLSAYERAIRNCPWAVALWEGYLRALERHEEAHNTIKDVFERALLGGFSQGSEYFELWQTYLDYLRRRIPMNTDENSKENKELDEFRISIARAVEYLLQYFGPEADPTCSLQRYWARIEAKYSKSTEKSRSIWNDIMAAGYGNQAQMWLEYFNLERTFGDTKHCRKILQRAVNSVSDWPESVCDALVNFEREEGTLETWVSAVRRTDSQMKRVNEQREKVAGKEAEANKHAEDKKQKSRAEKKGSKKFEKGGSEMQDMLSRRLQAAKKRKIDDAGPDIPKKKTDSKAGSFKVPFIPATDTGASPAKKVKADDNKPDQPQPMEQDAQDQSAKVKPSHDTAKEPLTVFVKNLAYDLQEDTIRNLFAECGEITEVRMISNHSKQFRGFCYVEFKDKESAEKALKLDKKPIDGRPMYVDPSRDTRKTPAPQKFQFSNDMEKNKLFVSGLPRSITKSDLHKLFGKYGEIKDIRIVTYKNGTPKGLAFVEYSNEADAAKAVFGTDGTQMGQFTVNVAISNPPKRRPKQGDEPMETAPPQDAPKKSAPKSLGAKGVTGPRGKGRTQLSMVPRALQRNKPSAPDTKPQTQTAEPGAEKSTPDGGGDQKPVQKLSNADFAKMMMMKK